MSSSSRDDDQNGAEPVYGPAYTAREAGPRQSSPPAAMPAKSAATEASSHGFEGPSPPYTAPYPPYPSDVPDTLPIPVNVAAALAYLVAPAVVFLLLAPYRSQPLVRFHSWQAIFYFVAAVALREVEQLLVSMLPSPVAFTLGGLLLLLLGAGWAVAVLKALQGETWLLPLVGPYAQRTGRATSSRVE